MTASSMAMPDDDTNVYGNGDAPGDLLDDFRIELEQAADDIDRLTKGLQDRNLVVERLEMLTTEILGLLSAPAVVVDIDGRIVAISQGAIDRYPGLSEEALGELAPSVLSSQLAGDIMAVARAAQAEQREVLEPTGEAGHAVGRWADITGASVLVLPGSWALALLST